MELFESKLAQATAPETRDILGAIGLVVQNDGTQAQEMEYMSRLTFNLVRNYSLPSCMRPSIFRH